MAEREYRFEVSGDAREALREVVDALLVGARQHGEPVEVLSFLFSVRDGLRCTVGDDALPLLS